MQNKQVTQNFINGLTSKTKHLFVESNTNGVLILYSYGYHFPLCIKLLDDTILINKEGYSQSTARHKGLVSRDLGFSNFEDLEKNKTNDILLFTTEQLKQILRDDILNKSQLVEREI